VRVRGHSHTSSNRSTTITATSFKLSLQVLQVLLYCYRCCYCCYMPLIRFSKPAQIMLSRLRTSKQTFTAPFAWPTTMYRSLGASCRHVIGDSVAGVSCRSVCRSSIARSVTVPSAPPQTCLHWHACQQWLCKRPTYARVSFSCKDNIFIANYCVCVQCERLKL
jgi:hypothetical protein